MVCSESRSRECRWWRRVRWCRRSSRCPSKFRRSTLPPQPQPPPPAWGRTRARPERCTTRRSRRASESAEFRCRSGSRTRATRARASASAWATRAASRRYSLRTSRPLRTARRRSATSSQRTTSSWRHTTPRSPTCYTRDSSRFSALLRFASLSRVVLLLTFRFRLTAPKARAQLSLLCHSIRIAILLIRKIHKHCISCSPFQSHHNHITSQSEHLCHTGTAHTHTPLLLYIYIILLYILSIRVLSFYCTVVHLSSNSSFGRALGLIERHQSRPHYSLIRSPLVICEKFDRIVSYLLVVPVFSSLLATSVVSSSTVYTGSTVQFSNRLNMAIRKVSVAHSCDS